MKHNIGVAVIIGLVITSSLYIWNSTNFSKTQKNILLSSIIFPPLQWFGILLILLINNFKTNSTNNNLDDKESKSNSSMNDLINLKNSGIVTEEEYLEKVEKIRIKKIKQLIDSSVEYKQLKSLFDSELLTKEEFDNKIEILKVLKSTAEPTNRKESIIQKGDKMLENIFYINNKSYSIQKIIVEFEDGNYFINQETIITITDGSQKKIQEIPELLFLLEYYPPS